MQIATPTAQQAANQKPPTVQLLANQQGQIQIGHIAPANQQQANVQVGHQILTGNPAQIQVRSAQTTPQVCELMGGRNHWCSRAKQDRLGRIPSDQAYLISCFITIYYHCCAGSAIDAQVSYLPSFFLSYPVLWVVIPW